VGNHYKLHHGAATLLILLVTTAIVSCCFALWQGAAFFSQASIMRQKYEQKSRLAEAVLNLGIACCKNNYKEIIAHGKKGEDTFCIDAGYWKIDECTGFRGTVLVEGFGKALQVKAALWDAHKKVFELGCTIVPLKKGHTDVKSYKTFSIKNWNICST